MKIHEMSCKESVKFWAEFIGIIAGVVGVIFLIGQYEEMVKATKATLNAVKVSQDQMIITKRQLDDSEAQLRAWLRIETIQIRRVTNSTKLQNYPGKYNVEVSMIIRNFGSTPAIDLAGSGLTITESEEIFEKKYGMTNEIKRWTSGTPIPNPGPGHGGVGIMPQETFTNSYEMGSYNVGDNFYMESWLSYRDIFGHPWIIGEGGTYNFTNDLFSPDFINWGQFRDQNQTN
jgi:hypothetical protein